MTDNRIRTRIAPIEDCGLPFTEHEIARIKEIRGRRDALHWAKTNGRKIKGGRNRVNYWTYSNEQIWNITRAAEHRSEQ